MLPVNEGNDECIKCKEIARKIIYAVETGGQIYGKVRYDCYVGKKTNSTKETACTIGGAGNHAGTAKQLMQMILEKHPSIFRANDTAGIEKDLQKSWTNYDPGVGSAKAKCIQKIISTPEGIKCQDAFLDQQISSRIEKVEDMGVTNLDAQIMCANIVHLGGYTALERILKKTTKPYTLNNIYAALKTDQMDPSSDNQVGDKKYWCRQEKVFQWLKEKITGEYKEEEKMGMTRAAVVDLVLSWVGLKESDGSYKKIVDIYNGFTGSFPRGTKMQYGWAWCACTWSALAIKLGYTSIMPIEISCGYLIEAAKKMGIWVEKDSYVAKPGDAVLYDWDDSGSGDNTGWPDHVGIIVEVNEESGYFVVVEGNYGNAVKKRTLSINGRYIRGFICPKYDSDGTIENTVQTSGKSITTVAKEVIAGSWGNGTARKEALEKAGYNYSEVQAKVNEILNGGAATPTTSTSSTSAKKSVKASDYAQKGPSTSLAGTYKVTATKGLYMRHGAGTNKKSMVLIPYGTKVECYGYYSVSGNVKWLYIQVTLDGVTYTGFSSSAYIKKCNK